MFAHVDHHILLLSSQCDMAENVIPGLNDEMCTELDLLEADNFGDVARQDVLNDSTYPGH